MSGLSSGACSTFCSASLSSWIAVSGSSFIVPAGVDHRVFDFAAQHLSENSALLLDFVEQRAFRANSIGQRTRRRKALRRGRSRIAGTRSAAGGTGSGEIAAGRTRFRSFVGAGGGSLGNSRRLGLRCCWIDALHGLRLHVARIALEHGLRRDVGGLHVARGDRSFGQIGQTIDTGFEQPARFSQVRPSRPSAA